MTLLPPRPISNIRLLFVFVFLLLQSIDTLHAQYLQTISNMDEFNSLTANEQVYVHTDSEVYAPGDTIWFKAYIRNKASLKRSNLSRIFYLNLVKR